MPCSQRSGGGARGQAAGLELPSLVSTVSAAGLAESTQRVYRSGAKRYEEFCRRLKQPPFPMSENSLSLFAAHLYLEGVGAGTVRSYLAATRHLQIALGLGDPNRISMPRLEYVMRGMKKKAAGRQARIRRPITIRELKVLKQIWEKRPNRTDAMMLWAAAVMCFLGFLRSGEVVAPSDSAYDPAANLAYGDVRVDSVTNPQYLEVTIKASKTDFFRKGVTVYLGRTGREVCPVAAILRYMLTRGPTEGPFFKYKDGRYLTRARFVEEVRQALQQAGLQAGEFAGHSFCIGAATSAAEQGLPDWLIKTLGRWQSSAYTTYIRTPKETLCAVVLVTEKQEGDIGRV